MAKWSRKPEIAEELHGLALTAEEGFVLSRLDTPLTPEQVVELTGLPSDRVDNILSLLEDKGLVVSDTPSIRPAMATIPDGDFDAEPPPPEPLDLDPNLLDPSFKQLYDRRIQKLSLEARIALAGRQTREALFALCLDPEPVVIRAVLMNPELVRSHARVIALNHRDPAGLELLASTRDLLEDVQVEWLLLRNPQLPDELARRILAPKKTSAVFAVWADEGVAEAGRRSARDLIRSRFGAASAEERAALIFGTEGNVLPALAGLMLDGRTTTLLSARGYTSVVFVRNLIKFNSCPGALLTYLSKQALVRRNPQLRNMLIAHPNTPPEAKRRP